MKMGLRSGGSKCGLFVFYIDSSEIGQDLFQALGACCADQKAA